MDPTPRWFSYGWRVAALSAVLFPAIISSQVPRQGPFFDAPNPAEYAPDLFGVTSSFLKQAPSRGLLGGVVVLQSGDVIAAECEERVTRLHRFIASATYPSDPPDPRTTLHPETISNPIAGGCGIALHPDGYVYANMFEGQAGFGVARIDLTKLCWTPPGSPPPACRTDAVTKMGPPGNALGIAVVPIPANPADPMSHRIVYAGQGCRSGFPPPCTLVELDPVTGLVVNLIAVPVQFQYIDGLAFNPTGEYLFLTNRDPTFDLVVMKRTGGTFVVVQKVPMTTEPNGIAFHAASPKFVLTNNVNGTITRFDFPGDDYTAAPIQSRFAGGGFRGDLMQAGPDGCLYLTQDGARYENAEETQENSIVQICDGFAPPPGVKPNDPPPPSSFCGFVYNDVDNDGIRDPGEPAIPGVNITLEGRDRLGRPVPPSATTTAADGAYCFNNLRAGTYTIQEGLTPGYLDGKDTRGTPEGTGTTQNDTFRDIVLDAGVQGQNNNFGELLPSSLCGYVYVDADNNGVRASGEAGIAGASVRLRGTDDLEAVVNIPMATGPDGAYCFRGLRPGTYTIIEENTPPGYVDGKDTPGTPAPRTTGNDVFSDIPLAQNTNGRDYNFGEILPAADLGIAVSAPATVVAGTTLNYTFNAVNNGTSTANDVAVTHSVPPDLKFVSLGKPVGWSCITPAPGGAGAITCTKSSMAVAERASFSIAVGSSCPLPNAGSVRLAATISSSTADPNPLNNTSSATTAIVNPAPVISNVRVNPSTMWPPNHKMWDVRVDYTVAGGCGGTVTTRLDVASNEPANGADWQIRDAHNLRLRSERNGGGSGRVYTIFIVATDPTTGISRTSTVPVTVVHDQGQGKR